MMITDALWQFGPTAIPREMHATHAGFPLESRWAPVELISRSRSDFSLGPNSPWIKETKIPARLRTCGSGCQKDVRLLTCLPRHSLFQSCPYGTSTRCKGASSVASPEGGPCPPPEPAGSYSPSSQACWSLRFLRVLRREGMPCARQCGNPDMRRGETVRRTRV